MLEWSAVKDRKVTRVALSVYFPPVALPPFLWVTAHLNDVSTEGAPQALLFRIVELIIGEVPGVFHFRLRHVLKWGKADLSFKPFLYLWSELLLYHPVSGPCTLIISFCPIRTSPVSNDLHLSWSWRAYILCLPWWGSIPAVAHLLSLQSSPAGCGSFWLQFPSYSPLMGSGMSFPPFRQEFLKETTVRRCLK